MLTAAAVGEAKGARVCGRRAQNQLDPSTAARRNKGEGFMAPVPFKVRSH